MRYQHKVSVPEEMTNRGKVSENLFGIRQVTEGTDRHAESHISGTICSRSAAGARG